MNTRGPFAIQLMIEDTRGDQDPPLLVIADMAALLAVNLLGSKVIDEFSTHVRRDGTAMVEFISTAPEPERRDTCLAVAVVFESECGQHADVKLCNVRLLDGYAVLRFKLELLQNPGDRTGTSRIRSRAELRRRMEALAPQAAEAFERISTARANLPAPRVPVRRRVRREP